MNECYAIDARGNARLGNSRATIPILLYSMFKLYVWAGRSINRMSHVLVIEFNPVQRALPYSKLVRERVTL